jgi:hypothetical protein
MRVTQAQPSVPGRRRPTHRRTLLDELCPEAIADALALLLRRKQRVKPSDDPARCETVTGARTLLVTANLSR